MKMRRGEMFVVEVLLVAAATSAFGEDLTSPNLNTSVNPSIPHLSTSAAASTFRRALVHCEITVGANDVRPETRLGTTAKSGIATPTDISGSGCNDPDAVTSLTLKIDDVDVLALDQLQVCRFSNVERVTVVGRLTNGSVTSLNCFRNIRHVTLRHAGIDVIQPSLFYDGFRSDDFRSVYVSDSGVEELASGVFDGRRMRYLEDVDLSMNNLTKVINATFCDLSTLTTLNLSHNAITYITPHAFVNTDIRGRQQETDAWSKLNVVDLSYNDLSFIDSQVFDSPLKTVRKLLLQHNHLSRLPRNVIESLKQLVLINLAYNEIVWLDVGAFSSISLRHVDLSHNALRKLISMTFLYLPAAELIDLSHNQLRQVYKYAFYRVCKNAPVEVVARGSASAGSAAGGRHVTISLRANRLDTEVVYQMMTMFRQQQQGAGGGGGRGCWMSVDLRENRISHLLDVKAATALARYDPGDEATCGGSVEIKLAANDLQCDCTLAGNIELLERIAGGDRSWLDPSNMADWRQLACSRPEAVRGRGFTVAEFIDSSNCTSERPTGSTKSDHVTQSGLDVIRRRHPLVDARRRRKYGEQKHYVDTGSAEVERAQSTVKYLLSSDIRASRRLSTSGESAALVALALCAAMLALLGGLLLCRAGVRRSRAGGGRTRQCRQKRDLFVVYADDDEAWVTGTLLDVIFTRHPCYDVILQQHLQHSCDTHSTDNKWNSYEQMVFGSVIDHSTMTIVVLSGNFLSTVWSSVDFRSLLVNKVDSQRHRFLFIFLDDDVMRDAADADIPDDRKQLYDCAATQGRLAAGEPQFAERLCDYLLPPSGPQVDPDANDCVDSDESVALIANCRHQRY